MARPKPLEQKQKLEDRETDLATEPSRNKQRRALCKAATEREGFRRGEKREDREELQGRGGKGNLETHAQEHAAENTAKLFPSSRDPL